MVVASEVEGDEKDEEDGDEAYVEVLSDERDGGLCSRAVSFFDSL